MVTLPINPRTYVASASARPESVTTQRRPSKEQLYERDSLGEWLSGSDRVGCRTVHSRRVHILSVVIYTGHANKPLCSPYASSITRVCEMFKELNKYRVRKCLQEWKIIPLQGQEFMEVLTFFDPVSTLLVFPASESTNLDQSFTLQEKGEIQNFFYRGGRGYFTCGSAFWILKMRRWGASCLGPPNASLSYPIEKASEIPLIDGEAVGPLCPLPKGMIHGAGFYSTAITIKYGNKQCCVFLGGGGSLILKDRVSVLKSSILSVLHNPSAPPSKKDKKGGIIPKGPTLHSCALSHSLSSKRATDNSTLSSSLFPRKTQSLTDLTSALETVANGFTETELCPFRKVTSLAELNQLSERGCCVSPSLKGSLLPRMGVLACYDFEELKQLGLSQGKNSSEVKKIENAIVMAQTGKGAVLASMLHPYYKAEEVDPVRYERNFPNSGTNWHASMKRLSLLAARVDLFFFIMDTLETFDFNEK